MDKRLIFRYLYIIVRRDGEVTRTRADGIAR